MEKTKTYKKEVNTKHDQNEFIKNIALTIYSLCKHNLNFKMRKLTSYRSHNKRWSPGNLVPVNMLITIN